MDNKGNKKIAVVRCIWTNTGGTCKPRVFIKRYKDKDELRNWLDRLPFDGTKYQEWGIDLHEYILRNLKRRYHNIKKREYNGAGESWADVYDTGDMIYIHANAVEGESIEIERDNNGNNDLTIYYNNNTIRNPEFIKIAEGYPILYVVAHERPGRYDRYYIILLRGEYDEEKYGWTPYEYKILRRQV